MPAAGPMGQARPGERRRLRMVVRGAVQGVGFRPFVHRTANALGLAGWVRNTAAGVAIEAEGPADRLSVLVDTVLHRSPAPASIDGVDLDETEPVGGSGFAIRDSETGGAHVARVLPDLATCDDCLRELFDPADRRHRYPFVNCTRCGPRYSIVEAVPYDRSRTSMHRFAMCPACQREYDDPADRRFHAEPNACPGCGPRLDLWSPDGTSLARDDDALQAAAAAIRAGKIVAVKGIGGFHLLVDARDEAAVRRLRAAKARPSKPFAMMFPTLATVREACRPEVEEERLLGDPARPIVLIRRAAQSGLARSVAPDNPRLGALLPYAPLHHLLMHDLGFPVVATSGNRGDEPIATDEHDALRRLAGIAELFLVHDRPIVRPVDDSVVQVMCGRPQVLRRARGLAPNPVVHGGLPDGILAFGAHLKATVALTVGGNLVASQHLGDLETGPARDAYRQALDDVARLHEARPRLAVRDAHPDYASSRAAEEAGVPVVAVQHHVAHVAACMAEHGLAPPVLGVAWDGTGYGPDGTVWGGEFIRITEAGWQRVAHLRPFRLPGGEAAAREPRRSALGLLAEVYGRGAFGMTRLAAVAAFAPTEREVLRNALARGLNAPWTTSAGRLFDGFAALCGLVQRASYEGEAASALEWAAEGSRTGRSYDMPVVERGTAPLVVDWGPAVVAALADRADGMPPAAVSEALHNGLARAIVAVAVRLEAQRIVLTGGCFQNRCLTEATVAGLRTASRQVFWHGRVPPNDGGIAVGQAAWAAWRPRKEA